MLDILLGAVTGAALGTALSKATSFLEDMGSTPCVNLSSSFNNPTGEQPNLGFYSSCEPLSVGYQTLHFPSTGRIVRLEN